MFSSTKLTTVQAGGVQIIGLELAVAPRNVKQKAPILESYDFTPFHRTVPSASPGYLECCSAAARSLSDTSSLVITTEFVNQLSALPDGIGDIMADQYSDSQRYCLLNYLRNPIGDFNNITKDIVFDSIISVNHLKPALDIVCDNNLAHKLRITELIDAQTTPWYTNVLASFDNIRIVVPEYTVWLKSCVDANDHSSERITVKQSEHDEKPATEDQHLVICSHTMEVSFSVMMPIAFYDIQRVHNLTS